MRDHLGHLGDPAEHLRAAVSSGGRSATRSAVHGRSPDRDTRSGIDAAAGEVVRALATERSHGVLVAGSAPRDGLVRDGLVRDDPTLLDVIRP